MYESDASQHASGRDVSNLAAPRVFISTDYVHKTGYGMHGTTRVSGGGWRGDATVQLPHLLVPVAARSGPALGSWSLGQGMGQRGWAG